MNSNYQDLIDFRRLLHAFPELSNQEHETADRIVEFVSRYQPTEIIKNLGGTGVAVIFEFGKSGKTIMLRCELDALPIHEENKVDYRSQNSGVSHKCGHDGHMAILSGMGKWLSEQDFDTGRVILLFQPAEETGSGADQVIRDSRFGTISPDYVFALHNIPGVQKHEIIFIDQGFSAEVQSLIIRLEGKECHAAEPQNGNNPAQAISEIISKVDKLNHHNLDNDRFSILTPVHINMGQPSYGISPGNGELHYTIRTWTGQEMDTLKSKVQNIVEEMSKTYKLEYEIEWLEYFPANRNDSEANQYIKTAAQMNGLSILTREHPFTFGEDFGWFAKAHQSAMFGIGAGLDTPALHSKEYDFPDELIETGLKMWQSIIQLILASNNQ